MTSENPNPDLEQLIDPFQREITYLRLSVTDRCNLRCTYCMTEDMSFLPKQQVLDFEEMETIAAVFVELGIRKIRLTGGEPLARNGIVGLVESLFALEGLDELVMTTNGILPPRYARALKDAGMGRLNISLDTLDSERYRAMTRVRELEDVFAGIRAAQRENFGRIKLNSLEHLQTCEAGGKATMEYAREHGLSPSGMNSARQDLVHKGVLPLSPSLKTGPRVARISA